MRPIGKKVATPVGVFPKRFLISTLRQLDREVGLTVPTLGRAAQRQAARPARSPCASMSIATDGRCITWKWRPTPRRPCVEVWQREWEAGLAASNAGEDLIAVEYPHAPEDAPWLGPRMAEEVEGQFLARAADGRYGCVLTSFVPFRPAGYSSRRSSA